MANLRTTISVLASAAVLQGCSAGLHNAPLNGPPPDRAVVLVGDIVNNIKCDMLAFVHDNPMLAAPGNAFGGTLTFTVDRSHEVSGGVTVGIPIATNIKIGANATAKNREVFGETISTPFVMRFDAADHSPSINCSQDNRTVHVIEAGGGAPVERHLSAPLLNLAELRRQLVVIEHGQPRVQFARFNFKGSIVLTRERGGGANITVLWISPTYANNVSSSFKIEYEVGTDWQRILHDANIDPTNSPTGPWLALLPADTRRTLEENLVTSSAPTPGPHIATPPTRASWLQRIADCETRGSMGYLARSTHLPVGGHYAAIGTICRRNPASFPR